MSSHKQTWIKHLLSEKQMSEAFVNSVFLALSGGFQDAYTYNTRDEVFSNAQTGNVVLMSQHFMNREWQIGLRYLFPLLAFVFGVFVAENVQNRFKYAKKMHWRQGILLAEIGILAIVGFIPNAYNMIATVMVSVCLCNAGADIPQSGWLFLCKHNVYRKFKKRNSRIVFVFKR